MFTENTAQDLNLAQDAPFTRALGAKLIDIDRNRINGSDELVLRKAVFGLLEIVGDLEARISAQEGPEARALWRAKLEAELAGPTPDEVRRGE